MKAYITMTMEVELPKDLEYLATVDWGDEEIGLTLTGPQIEVDEDNDEEMQYKYQDVKMTISRGQNVLHDLEIMQPTIENVIVE